MPPAPNTETTIQTLVTLPKLDAEEMATMNLIVNIAPKRTDDFSHFEMLRITEGRPVRMMILPGCLRLSVTVPGDDPLQAVSITESILRRATFEQADVNAAIQRVQQDQRSYWQAALDPFSVAKPKTRREEILYLYHRVFLPETIRLASAGTDPSKVGEEWAKRTQNWLPPKRVGPILSPLEPKPLSSNPGRVTTVELEGKEFAARDPALTTRLLALIALGSGKGSSLHRIWRAREAWSYRQEAVLWPTATGWKPRLIAAMTESNGDTARKALIEDIAGWTEDNSARALGMAEAILITGVDFNPIYFGTDARIGSSTEDKTFLAAYWQMKTGTAWNPRRMLDQMRLINLNELKETATDMVQDATIHVLPANG